MGVRLAFDCEVCGVEKREVNHWYELSAIGDLAVCIAKFEGVEDLKQVCGAACAHKLLDRWLSTGSLEKVVVPPVVVSEPKLQTPASPEKPA